MIIEKRKPDQCIIDQLKLEIDEFGLNFARSAKEYNFTLEAFNSLKYKIPTAFDFQKGDHVYGTSSMERQETSPYIKEVKNILNADQCTNSLFYSRGSYLPWHTNSDNPGTRTYILYTPTPGIFRYKNPETQEIIDDYDLEGWTQRTFIVKKEVFLWHCVFSPSIRFSWGFNRKNVNPS